MFAAEARALIATMPERERAILHGRLVDGATLVALGERFRLSRERIRQIQAKAQARLARNIAWDDDCAAIRYRAAALRERVGTAAPHDHPAVAQAFADGTEGMPAADSALLEALMLDAAGPYRKQDGWLNLEESCIPGTAELVAQLANRFGVIPAAAARERLAAAGILPDFIDMWIDRTGSLRREGDSVLDWSGNIVDKCVALLAYHNKTLDLRTLVNMVGEEHSERATPQALSQDERVHRSSRTDWALSAWGLEKYQGVAAAIDRRISAAGGPVRLRSAARAIASKYDVSESSVYAYAAAPMFVVKDGQVRRRRSDEPFVVTRQLRDCAGAFRPLPGVVSLLFAVDRDLLRGSGRASPAPVGVPLGIAPGEERTFQYAAGQLRVSWPIDGATGLRIGSLRMLARMVNARVDERLRLDFDIARALVTAERVPGD